MTGTESDTSIDRKDLHDALYPAAVWSIDRNQAIAGIRTVPELPAQRELNRRFTTLLLGVFASVALVLAIIGTYGVIAHATAQRTQEIGIRIALGADRRMILRMDVRPKRRSSVHHSAAR